jgi:hypothetical protein
VRSALLGVELPRLLLEVAAAESGEREERVTNGVRKLRSPLT